MATNTRFTRQADGAPSPLEPVGDLKGIGDHSLRRAAAELLVMAERYTRHAESMRRSAALFQVIESGEVALAGDLARTLEARGRATGRRPPQKHMEF